MIKVRVTRVGLAGASSLLALSSGLSACAAPAVDDGAESTSSDLTVQNPGTGVFELGWAYGTPTGYGFSAKSSVDEYVRVGTSMSFSIPAYFLWQRLYPNDPMPSDTARLSQLSAKVKAVFVKASGVTTSKSVATSAWTGTQTWDLSATSASFTIPKGTQTVRFEMTIKDAADATKTASIAQGDLSEVAVIGGSLPDKTLLFDTDYGHLRDRVLEGGAPVAGANLALAYTDWRAATLVDSSRIDRQIGSATAYGRFGSFEMPIVGDLVYEISCNAAIDGVWQDDMTLAANDKSRLLPAGGRTAYEASLPIPKKGGKIELVFHVKAYLVVDYSRYSSIKWQKYQQGDRILVADRWDNEHGLAFDNYDFATEKK
jgi:hypothetical protein